MPGTATFVLAGEPAPSAIHVGDKFASDRHTGVWPGNKQRRQRVPGLSLVDAGEIYSRIRNCPTRIWRLPGPFSLGTTDWKQHH